MFSCSKHCVIDPSKAATATSPILRRCTVAPWHSPAVAASRPLKLSSCKQVWHRALDLMACSKNAMSHVLKERYTPFSPTYGNHEKQSPTEDVATALLEEEAMRCANDDPLFIHPMFLKHEVCRYT